MADSGHHQAGVQHLARRQQEASAHPVAVLVQHQDQAALVAVQALERQRLGLAEAALEAHLQQLQRPV